MVEVDLFCNEPLRERLNPLSLKMEVGSIIRFVLKQDLRTMLSFYQIFKISVLSVFIALLCAIHGAAANQSIFDKEPVLFTIPDSGQEARKPEGGWCGEAVIQQALLYYGAYASQRTINRTGNPAHPDLYSNEVPAALENMGLETVAWNGELYIPSFINWVTGWISKGYPVMVGAKIYPTQHPEWSLDHFMLAIGFTKDSLIYNTTWNRVEEKKFGELAVVGTGLSFWSGVPVRNFGYAITGMRGKKTDKDHKPVRVIITARRIDQVDLTIRIEKLQKGKKYRLIKYADLISALKMSNQKTKSEVFIAEEGSKFFKETIQIDEIRVYRCLLEK
jgi:hypothetical protein